MRQFLYATTILTVTKSLTTEPTLELVGTFDGLANINGYTESCTFAANDWKFFDLNQGGAADSLSGDFPTTSTFTTDLQSDYSNNNVTGVLGIITVDDFIYMTDFTDKSIKIYNTNTNRLEQDPTMTWIDTFEGLKDSNGTTESCTYDAENDLWRFFDRGYVLPGNDGESDSLPGNYPVTDTFVQGRESFAKDLSSLQGVLGTITVGDTIYFADSFSGSVKSYDLNTESLNRMEWVSTFTGLKENNGTTESCHYDSNNDVWRFFDTGYVLPGNNGEMDTLSGDYPDNEVFNTGVSSDEFPGALGIAVVASTNTVYIADAANGSVRVYDTNTEALIGTIDLGFDGSTGYGVNGLCVDETNNVLYATSVGIDFNTFMYSTEDSGIWAIDLSDNNAVTRVYDPALDAVYDMYNDTALMGDDTGNMSNNYVFHPNGCAVKGNMVYFTETRLDLSGELGCIATDIDPNKLWTDTGRLSVAGDGLVVYNDWLIVSSWGSWDPAEMAGNLLYWDTTDMESQFVVGISGFVGPADIGVNNDGMVCVPSLMTGDIFFVQFNEFGNSVDIDYSGGLGYGLNGICYDEVNNDMYVTSVGIDFLNGVYYSNDAGIWRIDMDNNSYVTRVYTGAVDGVYDMETDTINTGDDDGNMTNNYVYHPNGCDVKGNRVYFTETRLDLTGELGVIATDIDKNKLWTDTGRLSSSGDGLKLIGDYIIVSAWNDFVNPFGAGSLLYWDTTDTQSTFMEGVTGLTSPADIGVTQNGMICVPSLLTGDMFFVQFENRKKIDLGGNKDSLGWNPNGLCYDETNNCLYVTSVGIDFVSEVGGYTDDVDAGIWKVDLSDYSVSTVVKGGDALVDQDGNALANYVFRPNGCTVGNNGVAYFIETTLTGSGYLGVLNENGFYVDTNKLNTIGDGLVTIGDYIVMSGIDFTGQPISLWYLDTTDEEATFTMAEDVGTFQGIADMGVNDDGVICCPNFNSNSEEYGYIYFVKFTEGQYYTTTTEVIASDTTEEEEIGDDSAESASNMSIYSVIVVVIAICQWM